ncbi:MFS transporter [Comamonas odontotermitis]|uniref:MFS transporter n=1 Tax=Comamonas odontotermitis TaxID=379895 RepID=UPI0037502F52
MTYRYRIATVFLIGFFIDCINIFMPAIALPKMSAEFHIDAATSAWVANSYILGLTLITPVSTWLAGRLGTRSILTGSMLLFGLAVWACGEASTFSQMIAWRFVQGVAGGVLIPVGQALTFNLFKGHERARISTLVMAVALIAPAVSPTLGGLIVDQGSWRWVFHSNIPLALVAAALAWAWVRETPRQPSLRPDIKGLLLASGGLASLLMGLSLYGAGHGVWSVSLSLAAGLLFVGMYLRHHRQSEDPILDLSLLRSQRLRMSIMVYHAIPGVFTGVNLLGIFYLQDTLHLGAQVTGRFMLVYACGAFFAMLISGHVYNRIGAKRLFCLGMVLHSLGIATLALVSSAADIPTLVIAYALMGIGGGIGSNTAQTTALLDFEGPQMQRASVIWNINRQMAFSLGATAFLVLFSVLLQQLGAIHAYQWTFVIASLAGIAPLLRIGSLTTAKGCHATHHH